MRLGGGGWRVSDSVGSGELISCVAPCVCWRSLFLLAVERRSVCSSLRGVRCVGVWFLVLSAVEGCLYSSKSMVKCGEGLLLCLQWSGLCLAPNER